MWELVLLVPRDFLGEEPLKSSSAHQLWQCGGVTEGVGQPDALRGHPEFVAEEFLAIEELADQRFTRGHHGIGLDPHAT